MKDSLLKKSKRKIQVLLGKYVPYNSGYKPSGVYRSIRALQDVPAGRGASLTEVFPAHVSDFYLTEEFSQVCSDYLRPSPTAHFSPAYVAEVPDARLFTDPIQSNVAIISADNKVVGEASYQYRGQAYSAHPEDNLVFGQKFFPEPRKYPGTVLSLLAGYAAMDYFFHWINDSLPKIKLVKETGLLEKVDWFLVPTYKYQYQKETLQTLGIAEEKIIDAEKNRHIQADRILTTSMPRLGAHIPVWVYDFYRHDFLRTYSSGSTYSPLVYISRRDAQFRNVTNETELLEMARAYGFKDYTLSSMPFAEQAKLFASARVILSPHGAGLSNLVFCQEGTQVIEFFAGGYVKPTYHNLAGKTGLAYHHLVFGPRSAAHDTYTGVPLPITVNVESVREVLEEVVNNAHSRLHPDKLST